MNVSWYTTDVMNPDERLNFLVISFEEGKTASDCARELGLSRQRIHQLIHAYGIYYEKYKNRRQRVRQGREVRRECQRCDKVFVMKQNGAAVKFCSYNCKREWNKAYSRIWHRRYYQSERGREYKKQRWDEQYLFRDESIIKVCPTCKKGFHPRLLLSKMKYCSQACYLARGKALDKQ